MSRVGVIADPFVSLGFRLAGVRPRVVESPAAAGRALAQMADEPDWGVILVQEDFVTDGARLPARGGDEGTPILIPFPGPSAARPPGEAEAYVAELLRRAVGYRVRLR